MAKAEIDLALLNIGRMTLTIDLCTALTVILCWFGGHSGGQVQIERCVAANDGGALYALAPVQFSVVSPTSGCKDEVKEPRTTMAENVAGGRGGGITAWAPVSVGFGYRLVCKCVHSLYNLARRC